jgi:4-amino-4-deoxy-L-arabinose transferase-like glycosyltransferase
MTSRSRFAAGLLLVLLIALSLRVVFPAADPPWRTTVGVVWHDEGAWVHNARNKALFGAWRQDEWNPMFVAPVFTGLEYLSFAAFGVGVRQARLVVELAGVGSVILLALGVRRVGGDLAGLIAGALAATNYVYVMYDRAAIMEGLMTAFIVASWYCSARAREQPAWGAAAGVCAVLAYFTKAAAAFYVGALGLIAVWTLRDRGQEKRQAWWTLAGLGGGFAIALAFFVLPHWADYWFYNWQMSVTRKPSYTVKAILDRLSWLPILHDTFTRMWFELAVGAAGVATLVARWRTSSTAERLLALWVTIGTLELIVHDVGNERRFVFLIPALVASTALVLGRDRRVAAGPVPVLALPILLYAAYVVCGPLARLPFLYEVREPVRVAAAAAVAVTAAAFTFRRPLAAWAARQTLTPAAAAAIALVVVAGDLAQFVQWAAGRTYKNYEASLLIGRVLPAGTLVHGKLANGLSLENRIRPIFVGHEFGNYTDRKTRDDVRYILTYTAPSTGYEGSQIMDVLAAYPGRRVIMTFDVAESIGGHDRAALIDKFGRSGTPRAHD